MKGVCAAVEARWFEYVVVHASKSLRLVLPPKVALFVWQARRNRIATRANLVRRGIHVEGGVACSLCNGGSETTNHLLIHCSLI